MPACRARAAATCLALVALSIRLQSVSGLRLETIGGSSGPDVERGLTDLYPAPSVAPTEGPTDITTFLTTGVAKGSTTLFVASANGFGFGDMISIDNGETTETRSIVTLGSVVYIVLDSPLANSYPAGSTVSRLTPHPDHFPFEHPVEAAPDTHVESAAVVAPQQGPFNAGVSGGAVSVRGDPHVTNMAGQTFDVRRVGTHRLIAIPQGFEFEEADGSLLYVDASVESAGSACEGLYVKSVRARGRWLNSFGPMSFRANSDKFGAPDAIEILIGKNRTSMTPSQLRSLPQSLVNVTESNYKRIPASGKTRVLAVSLSFGPVGLDIFWVYKVTPTGSILFLNFEASGLEKAGADVGGILGNESHRWADSLPEECATKGHLLASTLLAVGPSRG